MKYYLMSQELKEALLAYLTTLPYGAVKDGIRALEEMPEASVEEAQALQKPKAVK